LGPDDGYGNQPEPNNRAVVEGGAANGVPALFAGMGRIGRTLTRASYQN